VGGPNDTGTGSVSLTTLGVAATENFDTLSNTAGSTTNTTLPTGWYITESGGGARDNEQYAVDTGGSTTGDIYSYGAAAATDRALGALRSGTLIPLYGAKFTNNTGSTITSLNVAYTGEEWRLGTAARTDQINFEISTNATDLSTGTYTGVAALNFVTPDTATTGAKNGNAAADRTALTTTISSLSIANGASFFIRWTDTDATGADDGLAVDDFSITANAAPPTSTLNIGDVTQAEGDSGQTAFNFTVSLTSPAGAGGVTFNASTADGTTNPANAGSDYTALTNQPFTITQGNSSTTVTVQVNGDTTVEPNETFFVNISSVTGATAGDTQGLGTITNDDVVLTGICQIQGSGATSPVVGQSVATRGIVTGLKLGSSGGFYVQDDACDADPNTSNGIFVFTGATLPAAAVVGNRVQVSGTVQEFIPSSDPNQKPQTELSGTITASVLSTGNPLPAPVTISAADTQVNNLENLERFEGMRVQVNSLTVVAPTQGTINEPNATVTSNGVFYGVVTGVARPFREPGVNASDPLPAGAPANVPRFDENPERLRVDSDAEPGTTAVNVSVGSVFSNVVGEMDYSFRTWTILPEATLTGGTNGGPTPAPVASVNEFTVASFNMERFFDTVNDGESGAPTLTASAFNNRLNKASLIIRNVQRYPDVIGVEEMENLSTLQSVAAKVNADAQSIDGLPNPNYTAYLVEGNDVGGIDVGFLVKESRVTTVDVTQFGKTDTYTNPNTGGQELLNDRPPLVLRATIARPGAGGTLAFTVIVNHLRSLSSINDEVTPNGSGAEGGRVRAKRRAQAEFLANLIQSRQTADPTEKIITVGDMNAFRINDGYVDVIGTILGTPAPADQVVLASSDLVNPDQTDLVDTLTPNERYSYSFDGNAQVLDHVIVNPNAHAILDRFVYARDDADQPVSDYADPAIPDRISDHDQPIAYFSLDAPQPAGSLIISEFRFRGPGSGPIDAPGEGDSIGAPAPSVTYDGVRSNAPGTQGENDEFIEFYNNTDSDITVATTDGSAGWALVASDGQTRFIIPNGTIIPARQHFIGVNTDGYSLAGYSGTPDNVLLPDGVTTAGGYTQEIPDGSGIALFRTASPANFNTSERLDAAGYSTVPALYREGNGLATGGAEIGADLEYSWSRHQCGFVAGVGCTTPGTPKDTGDNSTDFVSVDTTGAVQSLGAPGPESSTSPFQRNAQFPVALLDTARTASQSPNRVRDLTANPGGNASFGTMSIRRTVTNNTGGPITYIAFRIVQITTYPPASDAADLRALDSSDITVTLSNGTPVDVRGTFVEQPPNQPLGGGLNSSMAIGFLNLGGEVANGDSINVQFLLGIEKTGAFRFYINVEAFNESAVAPVTMQALKTQTQGAQRPRARGGR
jgi:predicted extracellular nuclease